MNKKEKELADLCLLQHFCECGSKKFFLYCIHQNNDEFNHDFRAVCIECGHVDDVDDFIYNTKKEEGWTHDE